MIGYTELKLLPPDGAFTEGDQEEVAKVFTLPTIQRFLRTRLWNNIVDHANLPISDLVTEEGKLRAAYIKGSISVLHDLLSIAIETEAQKLANQQLGTGE